MTTSTSAVGHDGAFGAEAFAFLRDLGANNERDWFQANRDRYDAAIESALAFVEDVGEQLAESNPGLRYSTKTNGSGSLMRINRDVRFSQDKSPYKTNLSGMWWIGPGKKTQHPAYGFQLEADRMRLMGGMFGFDKSQLARYRDAVADDQLGERLATAVAELEAAGHAISGEHYKRVPAGFAVDHPREKLARHNALYASPPDLTVAQLTSPDATGVVVERLDATRPIVAWLAEVFD